MQARAPAIVAGAAAGSATRLAATPRRGTCGSMRTISGPQTSWADVGTARARARARGIHRSNPPARGRASTRRAPVAAAERAKPSERESHGSTISRIVTARDRTATPIAGRPSASASIATAAIAAARMTLGSGVTSATNAASTSIAPITLPPRDAPHSASRANAAPTTIAQFAPDTAVRCDSDEAFIAASVSGSRLVVSPTASPGTRPAPGWGRPRVEATRPSRSPSKNAHTPAGVEADSTELVRTTRAARSPGSEGTARPLSRTSLPMLAASSADRPSASTRIRAGTLPVTARAPARTRVATASNHAPPSGEPSMRPVTVTSSSRWRPPSASRAAICARVDPAVATVPAAAAEQASATATIASTADRRHASAVVAHAARARTTASGVGSEIIVLAPAVAQVAAATETARRDRRRAPGRPLTRAPGLGCP